MKPVTAGRGGESCSLCSGGGGGGLLVLRAGPDGEIKNGSRAAEGYGAGGGLDDESGAVGVVIIYIE